MDRFVPEFFDEKQWCFFRDAVSSWWPVPETLASIRKRWSRGAFSKRSLFGDRAFKPTFQRVGVYQSSLLELKSATSETSELRNSSHVITRGKFWRPFRVDFNYQGSARQFSRDLGNVRRRHSAGAAASRLEINEHGNLAVANNFVEFLCVYFQWLRHRWYRCLACSASSDIRKVLHWFRH
jgi:hypothetical protein